MLSKEQEQEIKKQLLEQIEQNFPEDKKENARQQIKSMKGVAFEEFLKQNNLIKSGEAANQCVFCSIVFGDIPSTKIGENNKALAVLELNPISKGHAIIIPKEHISKEEDIPNEARILARDMGEKIKKTFGPKDISYFNTNLFGHEVINVLPIYNDETPESKKLQSTPEELTQISKELSQSKETIEHTEKQESNQEEINEKNTWLPNRIP